MKKWVWVAICAINIGSFAARADDAKPDVAAPEFAVRSFVGALNDYNFRRAASYVAGGRPEAATTLADFEKWLRQERMTLSIGDLHAKTNSAVAIVTLRLAITQDPRAAAGSGPFIHSEQLQLRAAATGWQIVPEDPAKFEDPEDNNFLSLMASGLAHPQQFVTLREAAQANSCLSNLRQVALGMLMFLQDHDMRFALKAASFKKSLMPYVRSEAIFVCPSDKRLMDSVGHLKEERPGDDSSYAFNAELEGVALATIVNPAVTVMLYEGKGGVLDFRHQGYANIACVDGSVRRVNRKQAKALRWRK